MGADDQLLRRRLVDLHPTTRYKAVGLEEIAGFPGAVSRPTSPAVNPSTRPTRVQPLEDPDASHRPPRASPQPRPALRTLFSKVHGLCVLRVGPLRAPVRRPMSCRAPVRPVPAPAGSSATRPRQGAAGERLRHQERRHRARDPHRRPSRIFDGRAAPLRALGLKRGRVAGQLSAGFRAWAPSAERSFRGGAVGLLERGVPPLRAPQRAHRSAKPATPPSARPPTACPPEKPRVFLERAPPGGGSTPSPGRPAA